MKKRIHFICNLAITLSLLLVAMGVNAQNTDQEFVPYSGQEGKDVVWVPTPQTLVDAMLSMAKVTSADYVIDLGSGDGRLVITAAKLGATALGVEYNPDMVALANRAAVEDGVTEKAKFIQADIFETDFSKATVLTMFLLPDLNLRLLPTILDMKPGTRIVTNTFSIGDWEPDQTKEISMESNWTIAHLWIVPAKVEGTWKIDDGHVIITQNYQYISGTITFGGNEMKFTGILNGDKISGKIDGIEFTGTVNGDTMFGTHDGGGTWRATR
jgi:Predicted RNA methylase